MPKKLLPPQPASPDWTFLSNHTHVLVCLHRNPDLRLREIAQIVRITERSVQNILVDLEEAGVVSHRKEGRCNVYRIHLDKPLRHPLESHHTIGELLAAIAKRSHFKALALALLLALHLTPAAGAAAPRVSPARTTKTTCPVSSRPLARIPHGNCRLQCA